MRKQRALKRVPCGQRSTPVETRANRTVYCPRCRRARELAYSLRSTAWPVVDDPVSRLWIRDFRDSIERDQESIADAVRIAIRDGVIGAPRRRRPFAVEITALELALDIEASRVVSAYRRVAA